jgi:hypothetical protein
MSETTYEVVDKVDAEASGSTTSFFEGPVTDGTVEADDTTFEVYDQVDQTNSPETDHPTSFYSDEMIYEGLLYGNEVIEEIRTLEASAVANAAAAAVSATEAQSSEDDAETAQIAAEAASALAEAARVAAEAAKVAAELAETNAETAETNAETAETNAEAAQAAAAASAAAALASENAAALAETNAETAETNAEAAQAAAAASQSAAATSATNAANSASAAATSETNAGNSASAAATSATNAANSATAAQTAETNAETAETNAEAAEVAAAAHAADASASEGAAAASEIAAALSASNASTSETNAANSASAAATSAANAAAAVQAAAANDAPLMNGVAAVGVGTQWAREDHVHPTDTSRAPLASPTFTGVPAAPTAAPGTNTTQLATTAFVAAAVTGGGAPTSADYLVRTADAGLSAERVVTDTASVTWDWATGSQAKANLAFASQADAEGGSATDKALNALRVLQSIRKNVFPSGTSMLFQQSAAPTGWTKQTTHNDKALRLTSGSVGTGGSSAFSTVFGKTATDSFTLTNSHLPASISSSAGTAAALSGGSFVALLSGGAGTLNGALNNSGLGGNSFQAGMDIRVQYVDFIIANKD